MGDEVVEFGSVNTRNFQSLQNIGAVVQHSEGVSGGACRATPVQALRGLVWRHPALRMPPHPPASSPSLWEASLVPGRGQSPALH